MAAQTSAALYPRLDGAEAQSGALPFCMRRRAFQVSPKLPFPFWSTGRARLQLQEKAFLHFGAAKSLIALQIPVKQKPLRAGLLHAGCWCGREPWRWVPKLCAPPTLQPPTASRGFLPYSSLLLPMLPAAIPNPAPKEEGETQKQQAHCCCTYGKQRAWQQKGCQHLGWMTAALCHSRALRGGMG